MKLENIIQGKAYVLGDNIDTDQIIPAEFLTLNPAIAEEYRQFGRHALAGVPPAQGGLPKGHVPFHKNETDLVSDYQIIVGGRNFGCGSSREHAPIALDAAGIKAVVAEFYARIFYRNAVSTGDELRINLEACIMENLTTGEKYSLRPLGEVVPILEAGGVFPYARSKGMLPS